MNEPTADRDSETKILEAAFADLDEGVTPTLETLSERFPGCEERVRNALTKIGSYRRWVQKERSARRSASVEALLAPDRILGDFRVEGLIGAGGMGQVFRARQESLGGREVALKVLPPAQVAKDSRFVERFRREASLAADVHHPGIAEVYGSGEEGGLLFFAMRLVEGRTLAEVLASLAAERRLGNLRYVSREYVWKVVKLVGEVASALGAIHARGLVHRDVKPSNIILENAGEGDHRALGAKPVLVDFGLLRPVEGPGQTGSMTVLGTAAYASPEGQLGKVVDPRADVFSLGVVLHDLLALTAPGERGLATAGLADIRAKNSAVDARLAAIVKMALEERSSLRYANGEEFRKELERYLRGEALEALPPAPIGRVRLWVRRNPLRTVRVIGVALLLAVMLVTLGMLAYAMTDVYTTASEGARHELEGDLVEASDAYLRLHKMQTRASFIPGLGNAIGRAEEYASTAPGGIGQICLTLRGNTEGEWREGYSLMQGFLLTPGNERKLNDEHWKETIFRFLGRVVTDPEESQIQRLFAAETVAHYYLVHPVSSGQLDSREAWEVELEVALREVAFAEGQNPTLRGMAVSALSGITSIELFEDLVSLIDNQDGELSRLAAAATDRLWWRLRAAHQLHEAAPLLLDEWALAAYKSLCVHAGPNTTSWFGVLYNVAWTRHACGYSLVDVGVPSLVEYLRGIRRGFEAGDEGEVPPFVPPLFNAGWFSGARDRARIRQYNLYSKDESPYETYTNLWDDNPTSSRELPTQDSVENEGDGAGNMARFLFEGQEPVVADAGIRASWEQAESEFDGSGFLDLKRPGSSRFQLKMRIPESVPGALISIRHCHSARFFLPNTGRARVRVFVVGHEAGSMELDAPLGAWWCHFWMDPWLFAGRESATLCIELVQATSTYRLYGVKVEFVLPATRALRPIAGE